MTKSLNDVFLVFLFLFSIFTSCHAILNKRDPRAGFGWVVTSLVFIGFGPCLYWLFGINRIRTFARKIYHLGRWNHEKKSTSDKSSFKLSEDHPFFLKDFRGILHVSEKVNRHPLMIGNAIWILHNGEEAYPEMLRGIRAAKKFIYLCTYIFEADKTGFEFVQALGEAQKRGVEVLVLIDGFGDIYSKPSIHHFLKAKGIRVERFLPLSFSVNSLHFNLRNHRKLLVVDGHVGFTGGMNIRDRHFLGSKNKKTISDIHFKVEGPAVLELQEVFLEDWFFVTRESLPWEAHPHALLPGYSVCRVISGGPNEDFEKINWILLGALAWAKTKIQIMTPYFVPDPSMISALNTAALRGVQVEVILPEKNNLPFVSWANRALLREMLECGVGFYYQPPPFSHSKLFVVDESYSLIGSSNWDDRSLKLNFELDLEVYDPAFAQKLSGHFNEVLGKAREITLAEIVKDPISEKFRNSLVKLFSPYL